MHRVITILCIHAGALTYACDNIGQFWSGNTFWSQDWAYYMQPATGNDYTDPHADAYHLMQDDGQGKSEEGSPCKYPAYIMCPAFDEVQIIASDHGACPTGSYCQQLQDLANAAAIHKQDYHEQIIEQFAKVVNWDNPELLTANQIALQEAFVEVYTTSAQKGNYPYFTFHSNFTGLYGPQTRYAGDPFVFTKYIQDNQLVHLDDDAYMLAWAKYFAYLTTAKSIPTRQKFESTFAMLSKRVLVSKSVDLCWSLLMSGLKPKELTHEDIIPAELQGDTLEVWENLAVGNCNCGPNGIDITSGPTSNNYVACGAPSTRTSIDSCKAKCLENEDTCYGILYDSKTQSGYYIKKGTETATKSAMQCNFDGIHDVCMQFNSYAEPSGLAFHSSGTSNEKFTLPPKYSYELTYNSKGKTKASATSIHSLLQSCFANQKRVCYVTKTSVQTSAPDDNTTLVRTYTRRADDTPARCSNRCMTNPSCLAWTWDKDRCKLTTGIGTQTTAAMPANVVAMQKMELDTAFYCPDGQARDLCSQQCVPIDEPLQMGWCNKNWVNCVQGPDAAGNSPKADERLCVGGIMPDVPTGKKASAHRFTPVTANSTNSNNGKQQCLNSEGSFKPGDPTQICGADGLGRRNTTLHGLKGAFLTKDNSLCNTVGASYMQFGMVSVSQAKTLFQNWQSWYVNVDMSQDPQDATSRFMTIQPVDSTFTYVTASHYRNTGTSNEWSNAYASTAGGILNKMTFTTTLPSDCGGGNVCVFPSCMYGWDKQSSTDFRYYTGALPDLQTNSCARSDNPYSRGSQAIQSYQNDAMSALREYVEVETTSNNQAARNKCIEKGSNSLTSDNDDGRTQNEGDSFCEFDATGFSYSYNAGESSTSASATKVHTNLLFFSTPRYQGTKLFWNQGKSDSSHHDELALLTYGGMITNEVNFDNLKAIQSSIKSTLPYKEWESGSLLHQPYSDLKYTSVNKNKFSNYISCVDSRHDAVAMTSNTGKLACASMDIWKDTHSGHEYSYYAESTGSNKTPSLSDTFFDHTIVEDVNIMQAQFDNELCYSKSAGPAPASDSQSQAAVAGYTGQGIFVKNLLASNNGNLRDITAKAMDPSHWLSTKYLTGYPATVNGVTTPQLRTANQIQMANYKVVRFDRINWQSFGTSLIRFDNPDTHNVSPEFHPYKLPGSYASKISTSTLDRWSSTGSAGFMCPVGVFVAQSKTSWKNIEAGTEQPKTTKDLGSWHKHAQLTLKCPANRPYRCSHLAIRQPWSGTCEYGFKYQGKSNNPRKFSGGPAGVPQFSGPQFTKSAKHNITSYLSKIHRNSLCNIYDHGCFNKEEIDNYPVCGQVEDGNSNSNMAGVLCGTEPTSGLTGGFCGGKFNENLDVTGGGGGPGATIDQVKAIDAYNACTKWPSAEKPCETGFMISWGSDPNATSPTPVCVPVGSAQKTKASHDSGRPATLQRVAAGSSDLWWPGFVAKKGSFAGVGPAYVNKFGSCSDTSTCQGFNLCGNGGTAWLQNCLSGSTPNVLDNCCAAPALTLSGKITITPGSKTITATPSTVCAGGRHLLLGSGRSGSSATCNQEVCIQHTGTVDAQTKLTVSAGHAAGYQSTLKELMFTFIEKDTQNTIETQSCLGPQNRLQGNLWKSGTPNCACQDKYEDVLRLSTCDPTTSCAYTHTRDEIDGFVFAPSLNINGILASKRSDLFHPCEPQTITEAKNTCIAMGKQCVGLYAGYVDDGKYCPVTVEDMADGSHNWIKRYTAPHRVRWVATPTLYNSVVKAGFSNFESLTADSVKAVCASQSDCIGYKQGTTSNHWSLVTSWTQSSSDSGSSNITFIFRPTTECPVGYPYAYDYNNIPLAGCCSKPDITSTDGGALLNNCPGKFYHDGLTVFYSRFSTCPPHAPCENGQSVRVQNGTNFQCKCICDDNYTGATCSECTRPNTEDDCTTCKPNYVKGIDGTCICQAGFDLETGCTSCLRGYTGADCQIDDCTYTVEKRQNSVTLKNALVAQRGDQMLYDGIYAAGDGTIPLSMQNSIVHQDGRYWWMYSSAMDTGGTLATGRREMSSTGMDAHDQIIHYTSGEWLYSIPEYKPWKIISSSTSDTNLTHCVETLTLKGCNSDFVDKCLQEAYRITYQKYGWKQFSTNVNVAVSDDTMYACLGPNATGPKVYTATQHKTEAMDLADILTDQDTWGAVCPPSSGGTPLTSATSAHDCAMQAQVAKALNWHWRSSNPSKCVTTNNLAAGAFEYNIDVNNCVSGGIYGTGKWRNLPNKPSLAIPAPSERLPLLPDWLRDAVVCAHNESTPFMLSEYRRHEWSGTSCNDPGVQHVEFHWLYSIPRGRPMQFSTVREATADLIVYANGYDQKMTASAVQQYGAGPQGCAKYCLVQNLGDLWHYSTSQNVCICTSVFDSKILNGKDSYQITHWGGRKVVAPSFSPGGEQQFPISCHGQRDGTIVHYPDSTSTGNAGYHVCSGRAILNETAFDNPPQDLIGILRQPDVMPAFALPPESVAVPEQTAVTTRAAGSAMACCKQCSGFLGAWRYAGGSCYCFIAKQNVHVNVTQLPVVSYTGGPVPPLSVLTASWLATGCTTNCAGCNIAYYQQLSNTVNILYDMYAWCTDAKKGEGNHNPNCCGYKGCGASLTCVPQQLTKYVEAVSKCWAPTPGYMCNPNITMSAWQENKQPPDNMYTLLTENMDYRDQCTAKCIRESKCRMAQFNAPSMECTLHAIEGVATEQDRETVNNVKAGITIATSVKSGGCLSTPAGCFYDPDLHTPAGTVRIGQCSAQNVDFAFAADVHLYYSDTPSSDLVSATLAPSCASSTVQDPVYTPIRPSTALKTVDSELFKNRFTVTDSTSLNHLLGVSSITNQTFKQWPLFDNSFPRTLKWITNLQAFSTSAEPVDNSPTRGKFQISQAWAPVPHPDINIDTCITQSSLAVTMAGIQSRQSYNATYYDIGNAIPPLQDPSLFYTLLAIEAEQRTACMDSLHAVDRTDPLPFVFMIQPPASDWKFTNYYGLPTYRSNLVTDMTPEPYPVIEHNKWEITSPSGPAPLPTPIPSQPTPPGPTATNISHHTIGTCDVTRYHYKKLAHSVVVKGIENMLQVGKELTTGNLTEDGCMQVCRSLILCRMAQYTADGTCKLYGFTVHAAACPVDTDTCEHFVTTVNGGCAVTKLFISTLITAPSSSVTIKDNCCLINLSF